MRGSSRPGGRPHEREAAPRPLATLAVLAALAAAVPASHAQSLLDGRRFDAQAGFTGKPVHVPKDVLSFAAGRFHSSDCDQYGYDTGAYRAVAQGDAIAFEAETVSAEYGRNVWKGVVRGDAIEGTFVFHRKPTWWRPNPEPLEHWFRGREIR